MYMILDMGTSNTRLWLCTETGESVGKKASFGAGTSKSMGKEYLYNQLKLLIQTLLEENSIQAEEIEHILVSGMAGSELGLMEIPHISLNADIYKLADSLQVHVLDKITGIPFVFVPGLKKETCTGLADIMRGEEVEAAGILQAVPQCSNAVLVLPGTHNKVICIDPQGKLTDFYTTFSGELLNGLITQSILSGQVDHQFTISEAQVLRGAAYASEYGLNSALFHIRVMAKNGTDKDALSSFLYGAVIGQDTALIRKVAAGRRIYIGGRENLKQVYGILLGEEAEQLSSEICANAVKAGLSVIHSLYHTRKRRDSVLSTIEAEKVIAIIRNPDEETFLQAMTALYRGGIRLAEVTFDRSGKVSKEQTAQLIRLLKDNLPMLVGAGTVTTKEDVLLAWQAGASYIISPNCDPEVIRLTRQLGLVSIPAAFTPTEIAAALSLGADYVKLFPADQLSAGYVKAVKAPLSDAKLLAVGGVDENNTADFIQNGFTGVGVGSNLYSKKLIAAKDFTALESLAKAYVNAAKKIYRGISMEKHSLLALCLLPMLGLSACSSGSNQAATDADTTTAVSTHEFMVGFGEANITPDFPVGMAGYGNEKTRISTGLLSYIYSHALAVTDKTGATALIVTIDNSATNTEVYNIIAQWALEEYQIPRENILISANHLHSAPFKTAEYMPVLTDGIKKSIQAAMEDRAPAEMYINTVETSKLSFVRHYWNAESKMYTPNHNTKGGGLVSHESEADKDMQLVKFTRSEDKKPIVLVNFQAHPLMSTSSTQTDISADWIGVMRDKVKEELNCNVLYFTGASGNLNSTSEIKGENVTTDFREHGKRAADYVINAEDSYIKVETGNIKSKQVTVTCSTNHSMDHLYSEALPIFEESDFEKAKQMAAENPNFFSLYHARRVVFNYRDGKTRDLTIGAIAIGDVVFSIHPYEMFDTNGMELKSGTVGNGNYTPDEQMENPYKMTVITTQSNGIDGGYLASKLHWTNGGYSTDTAQFAPGTAEQLVTEYLKIINELHG